MAGDVESQEDWLERLYALNAAIAVSGERLAGNVCYEHHQEDYVRSPPVALNRAKRERFRCACAGHERMLEIGVNGGHSAYVALTANPSLEFYGVDIGDHAYVRMAVEWLKAEFPGRVFFYEGSCLRVLPQLAKQGMRFDLFHIDGAKQTYYLDILNSHRLLPDGGAAMVIVDDLNMGAVEQMWRRCLREGLVQPASGFSPMDMRCPRRNAIGMLEPISAWRLRLHRTMASVRASRRKLRYRLESGLPNGRRRAVRGRRPQKGAADGERERPRP
jgi:predicted O-methyltransferase YrrM